MRLLIFLAVLALSACSTSKSGSSAGPSDQANESLGRVDLTDQLRRLPGLIVRGSGPSATFQVRGINSLNSGLEPLFVINGQPAQGYASVYDIVTPDNFKSARVLKEAESSVYGVRGANGVIVIQTKN